MQKDFVSYSKEKLEIQVDLGSKGQLKIGKPDIQISYFSGGPGGQHTNRHMNGVRVIYVIPKGFRRSSAKTKELITRSISQRSQDQNLHMAFIQLAHKLHRYFYVKPSRKKLKTPGWSKKKRLEDKKKQSLKKQSRKSPSVDL